MCEQSSMSSAAALREARRRKILENSANRLKLIEGINSSPGKNSADTFVEPLTEPKVVKAETVDTKNLDESNPKLKEVLKVNEELREISDFLIRHQNENSENETEEEEGIEVSDLEQTKESFFLQIFLQKRLHYVLLALSVNFLFFFNAGSLFYENILCPFYAVKAIELISKREYREDFQPFLFLLVAGMPRSWQKYTKTILLFVIITLSDLCIYLFTFIIGIKIINNY